MRLHKRFGLTGVGIVLVLIALGAVSANAQPSLVLNEVLKRMDEHRSRMSTLKTNVKMIKTDVLLNESETSEGTAFYVPGKGRDGLMRIDWIKPVPETLSVVDQKYTLYTPRLKRAITGNASDAKGRGKANNLFAFLSMSKNEIKASYKLSYVGQESVAGGTETWHVLMTPKGTSSYKSAEMWVDGNGMPIQIKITASNSDTTVILLSGLQKNIKMNLAIFEVKIPRGTQIVNG